VKSFRQKARSLSASSPSEAEEQLRQLAKKTRRVEALIRAGLSPRDAAANSDLDLSSLSSVSPTPHSFLTNVWNFALSTGAAPTQVFVVCAEAFTEAAENARQARVQLAGPQAATRMVMILPVLAIAGGVIAGYNPLKFLFGTLLGFTALLCAAALMFFAHRWSRHLVKKAQQWDWARGMSAEAMAISLSAGQSLEQARTWSRNVAEKYLENPENIRSELASCEEFVELAQRTGVALAGLLRTYAQLERATAKEEAQMRIEKLSVQLMIPLGVCVLPAFISVGVLPLVASVISSTALNS
jgi:tight adherence protein B